MSNYTLHLSEEYLPEGFRQDSAHKVYEPFISTEEELETEE